jgi:hypothetical protein|nr:MAG TPA: transcription termination factor Rho [Caudoviricetes sp.]
MILVKGNVERETESMATIALLKKEGFKELPSAPEEDKTAEDKTAEGTPAEDESKPDLESMSLEELKALAKEKGMSGVSSLNKDQLKEVLKDMV